MFPWYSGTGVNERGLGVVSTCAPLRAPLPLPPHLTPVPAAAPVWSTRVRGGQARQGPAASPGGGGFWFPRGRGALKAFAVDSTALLAAAPAWRVRLGCAAWGSPGRVPRCRAQGWPLAPSRAPRRPEVLAAPRHLEYIRRRRGFRRPRLPRIIE